MTNTTPPDWAEGYVTDVAYVHNFHPALSPLNLAFAAALAGVTPPDVDQPFAYLELGCGFGFTPALFAAANPHAQFWANDFLPAHIHHARAAADAAGTTNITFAQASFADLLQTQMPRFDFIVLHGVWSWVSPANRDHIAAIINRHLEPGGLGVVSYNCHPGWDSLLPLRHLIAQSAGSEGPSAERVDRALAAARRLRDAGADYFRGNPQASELLDQLARADRAYVAHEFFNEQWTLFHPGEVAAAVAPAGLAYVGQARAIDNVERFWFTADQQALLDTEPDVSARESIRDLILDRRFRHDLFVRDTAPSENAATAWIAARRFALVRPRPECSLAVDVRGEPVTLPPACFDPLLDALAEGPATAATLAAHPTLAGVTTPDLHEALATLVAIGHVQPTLGQAGEAARRASTERFNTAALNGARTGEPAPALASPVTGTGVPLTGGEQLLLDAYGAGIPLEMMSAGDSDGGPDPVERFRTARLPLLQQLGVA